MIQWPSDQRVGEYGPSGRGGLLPVGPFVQITPPVAEEFAWVNQGTATFQRCDRGYLLTATGVGSGGNLRLLTRALPPPPYTITTIFRPLRPGKNWLSCGMHLRNSGSGKIHAFHLNAASVGLSSRLWTNATTPSTVYQEITSHQDGGLTVLRVRDDGTNRLLSFSCDGVNFIQFSSQSRTTDFTPDEAGMLMSNENAVTPNLDVGMLWYSWDVQRG